MGPRYYISVPYVTNDCICCAERKLIYKFMRLASKEGIRKDKIPSWIHRKYGEIVIWRVLADGTPGMSLPCVLCRKKLDKMSIQWRAHLGPVWHSSRDEFVPKSKSTCKQLTVLKFSV